MRPGQLTSRARGLAGVLSLGGIAILAALLAPRPTLAEPYLAVRAGAKCSDCHTNMTGGGKRTPYASIHSKDILKDLDLVPIPARTRPFMGEINEYVGVGADFRFRATALFEDEPDSKGRVANDTVTRSNLETIDFRVEEGLLYLQVDPWPDVVTLYIDEQVAPGGATNREAFAMIANIFPWGLYAKAGRFFPAFGTRIFDDTSFVRSRTNFTFDNADNGVEIGMSPGPSFLAVSVTDGIQGNRDVLTSVNGYLLFDEVPVVRNVLLGASFARQSRDRNVASFYGGANLGPLSALGEVALIDDDTPSSSPHDQLAAYGEANLLLFGWLNLRGTADFVQVARGNDENRFGLGFEPFISRFVQPRIFYRASNAPPHDLSGNRAELIFELHLFF